ncbi:MAG TPA: ABC transporter permease subunit [Anaerolineaceae bacterium]
MRRFRLLWATLGILSAWWLLSLGLNKAIVPSPWLVIVEFGKEIFGSLGGHFLASFWRVSASMTLAILLATPAGLVLGQSTRLNHFFEPLIYLLYPIPKVVLVPVVLLIMGINDLSKIFMIFLILFFQVLVLVRDQAALIRPELVYSVRSVGAGRRALFKYVYFPATLPAVLTAVRQSIGTAVAVLYVVELVATQKGLGYYIYLYGSTMFDYPKMYAGILAMSMMGLGLYYAADALHHWLCPWQFTDSEKHI